VFEIHSLDFDEFLLFKGFSTPQIKADLSLLSHLSRPAISVSSGIKYHSKKLLSFFEEFVLFGGYPAVVLKTKKEDKINLLYELYSTYVRRDIKDFRAIENIAGFNRLVELLAHQIGNIINLSELCNSANLSRPTIEDYLFLLQSTFIATLLNPFFTNVRQEIVKSSKIYFNDCGLRNAVLRNFLPLKNRTDRGALFENAVFTELSKKLPPDYELRFWRTKSKAEVDFILKGRNLIPIEVKSAYSQVPSGLRSFMESHLSPYGIILNDTLLKKQRKAKNKTVYFYPFWLI
jgi:predicted AAA+ superfamily ATPase